MNIILLKVLLMKKSFRIQIILREIGEKLVIILFLNKKINLLKEFKLKDLMK